MTALPASADFTGASITEAQFKTAVTNQRDFLAGLLGTDGTVPTALATLKAPLSGVNPRTGAYTVAASDRGVVIYYTGAGGVTLTLPAITTTDFGVGYDVLVKNMASSAITIARSSTNTIDGATSVVLASGESAILFAATTSAWVTIGRQTTGHVLLAETALTSGSLLSLNSATTRVVVEAVGGGGGGGGGSASGGGSGGSGSYYRTNLLSTGGAASISYSLGAGGTAGTAAPTSGGNGGNTVVTINGTAFTAYGGNGGVADGGGGSGGTVDSNVSLRFASRGDAGVSGTSTGRTGSISAFSNAAAIEGAGVHGGGGGGSRSGGYAGGAGGAGMIVVREYS